MAKQKSKFNWWLLMIPVVIIAIYFFEVKKYIDYVNRHPDLKLAYDTKKHPKWGNNKYFWGKHHYTNYGIKEKSRKI